MSRKKIIQLVTGLCICMLTVSLASCGKKEPSISYNQTLKQAKSDGKSYYAMISLKNATPILLVTDGVYDEGREKQATFFATPYYTDSKKKVKKEEEISSSGTAYPLMADESGIYTTSGNEIDIYQIDKETKKLVLEKSYIEDYASDGTVKYTKSIEGKVKKSNESEFDKAMNTKAKVIHFKKIK